MNVKACAECDNQQAGRLRQSVNAGRQDAGAVGQNDKNNPPNHRDKTAIYTNHRSTMRPNCLTCKHITHDAEGLKVCGKVYGWLACMHCKTIQPITDYRHREIGLLCKTCMIVMAPTIKDDWREGYIGNGRDGEITPLPCCPGWDPVQVDARPVDRQKSLFEMED